MGVAYPPMPRPKKKLPPVRVQKDILLEIIASNIRELMDRKWKGQATQTDKIVALSKLSGVGKETIRKILVREQSPRVDNLHSIAMALGATAASLLQSQTQPDRTDSPPEETTRERPVTQRSQELLQRR